MFRYLSVNETIVNVLLLKIWSDFFYVDIAMSYAVTVQKFHFCIPEPACCPALGNTENIFFFQNPVDKQIQLLYTVQKVGC
jgi:hypothetical protein